MQARELPCNLNVLSGVNIREVLHSTSRGTMRHYTVDTAENGSDVMTQDIQQHRAVDNRTAAQSMTEFLY